MLKTYRFTELTTTDIQNLVRRNADSGHEIRNIVEAIMDQVHANGDAALRKYALSLDKVAIEHLFLNADEIDELAEGVNAQQRQALQTAYDNIYKFHLAQLKTEDKIETSPGVTCWREYRAIEKVGLYIPGGSAVLPSTFLMLGIPAKIAGCKHIIVCTPPQSDGKINAYIAYVAKLLGIEKIYLAGGAQAIAAMAYGTETIPKADKIFGPGNQFVTKAKTIIQSTTTTAIDMPAGPSEVLVIADETANPMFTAADLLAQAEHGPDSQAILVATSAKIVDRVVAEIKSQLTALPRAAIAEKALDNSYAVIAEDLHQAMGFSNEYAPEHLILATDHWLSISAEISNAGSVFLGNLTPESAGDYASGTNHTLPTSASARAYSGVSVDSFVKKITFQHITPEGIKSLATTVEILAELEGLHAHKNAMTLRKQAVINLKKNV